MKRSLFLFSFLLIFAVQSCGMYSFTGADTGEAETFQVNYFQNTADLVEPGIDRTFTLQLQDLIQNQTSLNLANDNADLIFEGEIIDFYIAPMTATADNTAAQNRLTIAVQVRYYNTLEPEKDFERRFSFYYDYPANQQLVGANLDSAIEEIYSRLTQDIFNAALTDW
ncbi:MAG: LptE family protein [Salegentibacter sp.]|uniref:Lipopolysaccharide-assembly n=1 Tax=Salegentibacter flavus TaxID=287099 RepID=A0A1I5ALV1_9FLAO|nr:MULTISPECIES: LptE family protein [Salegentibacter]MDR9456581.1 LptE family protein [Salegentibacter sp.]SFN63395.1 Lipopolysaccharide-assembly [Salegentibacter flavus]